jgi:hypothetical protein
MLTQAGRSYAARLGGSLLHAIGLPELVMRSARTYEDKAVRLAGKPQELARLRRRLAKTATRRRCSTRPLVRHLEQLYLQVARGALHHEAANDAQPDASLPLVSILIRPATTPRSAAGSHRAQRAGPAVRPLRNHRQRQQHQRGHRRPLARCSSAIRNCATTAPRARRRRQPRPLPDAGRRRIHRRRPGRRPAAYGKISRMMHFYQHYPSIGLVACWRQSTAADGSALPGAPLLPVETAVSGASLAAVLLTSEGGAGDVLCQPACLLLRRSGWARPSVTIKASATATWPASPARWRCWPSTNAPTCRRPCAAAPPPPPQAGRCA